MTPPTSAQLKIVHEAGLRTRLVSGPRKPPEKSKGWKRPCASEDCSTLLHHRHDGGYCYCCERRLQLEGRLAA